MVLPRAGRVDQRKKPYDAFRKILRADAKVHLAPKEVWTTRDIDTVKVKRSIVAIDEATVGDADSGRA